ncbi:protein Mpv17-like [Bolinopsis microptera]|uniref:protein Mpv17-like n=1 Tax=Bolinopsis microptera TaxID=2820187 RepID=UPI00307A1CDA
MSAFLRWYSRHLKKHQFAMNMVTTGTGFFLGDILSQQVIEKKGKDHELERTVRSVTVGSFYIAPVITFLYNFVDKVCGPSQTPLNSLKKTGFLSLLSPITSAGYVICNNVLQNKPLDYTINQLKDDLLTIVLVQYKIWIPTNFILMTVVPLRYRMVLSNFVGILWTCYLTHASNTGTHGTVKGEEEEKEKKPG